MGSKRIPQPGTLNPLPKPAPLKEWSFRYQAEVWIPDETDAFEDAPVEVFESTLLVTAFNDAREQSRLYGRTVTVFVTRWSAERKTWEPVAVFEDGREGSLKKLAYPG